MIPEPPLLIIASIADDLDLAQLPWCGAAAGNICVNPAKFKNLEMVEVIVDAMTFLVSRLTVAETDQYLAAVERETSFYPPSSAGQAAIGIAPGENVTSARFLPEINRRLLLLGKWIGESVAASAAAWLPSRTMTGFERYVETVDQYLADGPFPALFQTAFAQDPGGQFVTRGLRYLAGQEIRLSAPRAYGPAEITDRLVPIIENIAIYGKIDRVTRTRGMVPGETLEFTPSEDLGHVDVVIENERAKSDKAKI